MRSLSPAAKVAEPIFGRRRNPSRHGKLFLHVRSAMLPPGDEWRCEAFARGNTIQFRSIADVDRRSPPC